MTSPRKKPTGRVTPRAATAPSIPAGSVVLSAPVAALLLQILSSVQLAVSADSIEEQAALVALAKKELAGS